MRIDDCGECGKSMYSCVCSKVTDLKDHVDELVNYLGSEDEGFIQDSQDNGLLDAHIGFFVSY